MYIFSFLKTCQHFLVINYSNLHLIYIYLDLEPIIFSFSGLRENFEAFLYLIHLTLFFSIAFRLRETYKNSFQTLVYLLCYLLDLKLKQNSLLNYLYKYGIFQEILLMIRC